MLVAVCSDIIRDANDKILWFKLEDVYGNVAMVTTKQLKAAIKARKLRVNNLNIKLNKIEVKELYSDTDCDMVTRTSKGKKSSKHRANTKNSKSSKSTRKAKREMHHAAMKIAEASERSTESFAVMMEAVSPNPNESRENPVVTERHEDLGKSLDNFEDIEAARYAYNSNMNKSYSTIDNIGSNKKWHYTSGKNFDAKVQELNAHNNKVKILIPAIVNGAIRWRLKENQVESKEKLKSVPKGMWIETAEELHKFIHITKSNGAIWHCIEKVIGFKSEQHEYYNIIDLNGNTRYIERKILKNAIINNEIAIDNLFMTRLSSTGLIHLMENDMVKLYIKIEKVNTIDNADDMKALMYDVLDTVSKNRAFQKCNMYNIPTACGINCKLIEIISRHYILYIPDDVKKLNDGNGNNIFAEYLSKLWGNIKVKVFGGYGLTDAQCMFRHCKFEKLNLSTFCADNIINMNRMFENSDIKELILDGCNTSNVTDMSCMFASASIGKLNIERLSTKSVKNMAFMFYNAMIRNLDLMNFRTKNVVNMQEMFEGCTAENIYLHSSNFVITDKTNTAGIFDRCSAVLNCGSNIELHKLQDIED